MGKTAFTFTIDEHHALYLKRLCGKLNIAENEFIQEAVLEKLNNEGEKYLKERSQRADLGKALNVLDKVPDNLPEGEDKN
jgi:hypothetical protein